MTALITLGGIAAVVLLCRAADRWLARHIADKEF